MQEPHLERPLVLGSQGVAGLVQELPHIGLELYLVGRLPAAGGARFHENAIFDLAGAGEALRVGEAVIAAEATDGLALLLQEGEAGMLFDLLAELFQLAVDATFVEGRVEGGRVEEEVDVFREALDEVPSL